MFTVFYNIGSNIPEAKLQNQSINQIIDKKRGNLRNRRDTHITSKTLPSGVQTGSPNGVNVSLKQGEDEMNE